MSWSTRSLLAALVGAAVTTGGPAWADDEPTPGFPEKIIQWGVSSGETCEDIARSLYGGTQHMRLLLRYNRITCTPGAPLSTGLTLVLPAKVTNVPTARITSVNPVTQSRPSGGGWAPAFSGQPLNRNSNVNTRNAGRASIQFVDRSRIHLAEHTLVVIFGTASQTAVSKTLPPVAEVKSGELRAGLAALRGKRTAEVGIAGGGRVSAASRDTVIRKKGKRATVSVFDGQAGVSSAGKKVQVPKHYGTAVVERKPPTKPRPLPPAPAWDAGGSPLVTLTPGKQGTLQAQWKAVAGAASYRLEVARDEAFEQLILREETPADVRAFRGENLPVGDYWLRVRAIDGEDFLGIASTARAVSLVTGRFPSESLPQHGSVLEVSPYGVLELEPSKQLQLAVNGGAFEPAPRSIDFAITSPTKLAFRRADSAEPLEVELRYVPPKVAIAAQRQGNDLRVTARFDDLRGVDPATAIQPRLVARSTAGAIGTWPLAATDGAFVATVSPYEGEPVRLEVIDRDGRRLGHRVIDREGADAGPAPLPDAEPEVPAIGPTLPARPFSPRIDVLAWAPTQRNTVALGSTVDSGSGDGVGVTGEIYAAGTLDAVGLDGWLRYRRSEGGATDDASAWLGARYRVLALPDLQLATGLRVGFPLSDGGPPPRLEPSVALGAAYEQWSWLANLGGRIRLEDASLTGERTFVDPGQAYILAGGAFEALSWLRLHGALDGQTLFDDGLRFRGGLSLGIEAGTIVYGSLTGRVSPWNDMGGYVAGQAAVGLRSF